MQHLFAVFIAKPATTIKKVTVILAHHLTPSIQGELRVGSTKTTRVDSMTSTFKNATAPKVLEETPAFTNSTGNIFLQLAMPKLNEIKPTAKEIKRAVNKGREKTKKGRTTTKLKNLQYK